MIAFLALATVNGCGGAKSLSASKSPNTSAPSAPAFAPAPGTYSAAQSVSISDTPSPTAAIFYTTDGSTPTAGSSRYAGPISVTASTMLRALALEGAQTSSVASGSYTIAPPASHLAFVAQPSDATAGKAVAPAVTVALVDSEGNQVTTNTQVALTLQKNGSSATLAGTTSSAANAGVATFSNLVVNTAGSGYTLVASAPGLPSVQSAGFTIVAQLPSEQAAESDSFVDSIGVQTHISYTDTAYANWSQVLAKLEELGVRHIRDGLPTSNTFVSDFQQLGAAGIRCTCGFPLPNSFTAAQVVSFAQLAQSVEALEAPNECDAGTNCGGGGTTGVKNVVAFLPTIKAASTTSGLPVIGPSFQLQSSYASAGNLSSSMNFNNLHIYFGGRYPGSTGWGEGDPEGNFYGSFNWWIDQGNLDGPNTPDMVTETGYKAYPSTTQEGTIPESVEASYTPRTVLLSYVRGVKRTFIYELLDESTTTGYGLLANDFSEKPAFTALKNLIGTLQDPGAGFTPGALNYSISGSTSTLQHLLLQKRDGSYWLILWLEQSSYDATNNVSTPVSPQNVTLSIGAGSKFGNLIQFDNTGSASSGNLGTSGYSTPLSISDQVTVVEIAPK
ncbi:MAG TPA: chitobiase/beta-hexosaminidase C-terminal domain-containing protein [Terracidiphilus sp.]|nr:chitobiase/beta-hexosaminidase C-terminal domain-containing protein [Terracidiphilus sp.]